MNGAYVCLRKTAASADVSTLARQFGLRNEFDPGNGSHTIAFLRRVSATAADIDDAELLDADAIVHVASDAEDRVTDFCNALAHMLESTPRILRGSVGATNYTGNAMHNFAYAHQLVQQSGSVMRNAFLLPMSKTAEWWQKDWMERHTYFLPRYDDSGRMRNEGHALAAAKGIDALVRRTYRNESPDDYDFVTYFECADENVATFHEVRAALRDTARNPEWKFVREGPMWQGRRVASWASLFE